MKPEPRHFTKEAPCTKLDLWNCFKGRRGWLRVQVDAARAQIGLNAPRYMLSKGYVTVVEDKNAEYYVLTESGQKWLDTKFRAYLRNHPEDRDKVRNMPHNAVAIKS